MEMVWVGLRAGEGCPRVSDASTMDPLAFARQIYPKDEQFWYLRYHNYDYLAEIGRAEDEYDADPGLMFRCEHSKVALASLDNVECVCLQKDDGRPVCVQGPLRAGAVGGCGPRERARR